MAELEQRARIKKVASKFNVNPLMADNALDRQAGVYAKGLRLIKLPAFKAMDDARRQHMLGRFYDTYVSPAYTVSHMMPPDRDTWVREFNKPGGPSLRVSDFYLNNGKAKDALTDFQSTMLSVGAGASRALASIMNGPLMAGMRADQRLFGLKGFFPAPQKDTWRDRLLSEDAKIFADPHVRGYMRMNQGAIDDANFWFQSRPTHSYSEAVGTWVGEQAMMLPLYKVIGAPLAAGGKVLTADKFLRATTGGVAANLTRRCAATPTGQFLGRRLINAAEAYVGGIATGEPSAERNKDVVKFMVGGTILGELIPAALKGGAKGVAQVIGKRAMEKQLAHDLAIGGVPYVEAVTDQAHHELDNDIIGHDSAGQPITHDGTPESAEAGLKQATEADPVRTKVVTAAKVSLISIAREKFGPNTNWKKLTTAQKDEIRAEHGRRTAEASQTIPEHVPAVAAAETKKSIQQDIQQSPELAQTFAQINQMGAPFGISVENATQAAERDNIRDQTGSRSVQGATDKANRIAAKQKQPLINDIVKESARQATSKAKKQKVSFTQQLIEGSRAPDPRNYVSFKVNTLQNFTNNFRGAANKANQTLSNFLRGMDDDDFAREVKDQMGDKIHFEKPEDAMLWAVHHGEQIPAPIYNRAVRWLRDLDPTQTIGSLKAQGKILDHHIEMLSYTGKLDTEGNVFRSTVTSNWSSRTKWQRELLQDLGKQELDDYANVMGHFAKNYPDAYKLGLRELAKMQAARMRMKSLDQVTEITREIRKDIYQGGRARHAAGLERLQRHGYEAY